MCKIQYNANLSFTNIANQKGKKNPQNLTELCQKPEQDGKMSEVKSNRVTSGHSNGENCQLLENSEPQNCLISFVFVRNTYLFRIFLMVDFCVRTILFRMLLLVGLD